MPSTSQSLTLRMKAPVSLVNPSPKFKRMLLSPLGKVKRDRPVRGVAVASARILYLVSEIV